MVMPAPDAAAPASRRPAALGLVLASVLWGTTGTAAAAMPAAVSPLAIGAATMGIGGLVLSALSARPAIALLRAPASRRWILLGALGAVIYPLAFYTGMAWAGVAVGNVVALGSGPIFAAVLEWAVDRQRPGRAWMVATSAALIGIVLLAATGHGADRAGADSTPASLGVVCGLVAGAAYALYTYAAARVIATGAPSRAVMAGIFGGAAPVLLIVLVATGAALVASPTALGLASYLVLGPMVLAYLLFGWGLRGVRSSVATTITLLEPAVATLLAVLVLHERLGALGWVGLALVLGAVVALAAAGRRGRTEDHP
ncbi:DMT family transporter [Schumannella sp. 10F1B-5-1]|uniref:DMT family transporter n=1 Tax=Schumannella sp. 10F1B-5-1 TaxID=2590780 RepID=UPI001130D99D|nr:EamA family transporter [Schumannella sp. 10F1B-5-1]TPW70844.1 EamA family transporter [Schumannella sp. 10F1B-5-1]